MNAPGYSELESAWFQPLKLKCGILVSKFALSKFNLHRYNTGRMNLSEDVKLEEFVMGKDELSGADIKVGDCTS